MLWTDIVDPATLTGYARESALAYEARQGSLARWLPNRDIADIIARFIKGRTGLVDVADYRAYDAEPTVGRRQKAKRVTIELPAVGQEIPVTEYEQLRARGGTPTDQEILNAILDTTETVTRAVVDRVELTRGVVLATGRATVDQDDYDLDEDFGRPAGHQVVATNLWSTASVSRLAYLDALQETYRDTNGADPGCIVMSSRILRALAAGTEFQTQLLNGGARNASDSQVRDAITGAGLPDIVIYNRRVQVNGTSRKVLPDDTLLMLPAPVDVNDYRGTQLGATFWGRTLTSLDSSYGLAAGDEPGIVVGAYREPKPPMIASTISDAIALPVLANAELSLAAKVL